MMKLSRLFPLLALLLVASLRAESTHKEVRTASPWLAQNTIIAIPGYGGNIVETSMIAKRTPLLCQNLPRIEKVAIVSVSSGHEISPEQIITLGIDMLFVSQNMVVLQQALLKRTGVQVLALEANSLRASAQRVQQMVTMLGSSVQQKVFAYQRYSDRNVTLVTGRLKNLPVPQRVSLHHSMDNPLITTSRSSLNQDWIDLADDKNTAENWFGEHQQNRLGEVALEEIVTANSAVTIAMNKRDADVILNSPQWANVDVVIHHRVYVSPKGTFWWCRETSEEVLQLLQLAETFYPTRFADADICKETYELYRQSFGLTLSDAQMDDVLNPSR